MELHEVMDQLDLLETELTSKYQEIRAKLAPNPALAVPLPIDRKIKLLKLDLEFRLSKLQIGIFRFNLKRARYYAQPIEPTETTESAESKKPVIVVMGRRKNPLVIKGEKR